MKAPFLITALLASAALTLSGPAAAQSSDVETIAALKAQVEALTKRVNDLEQRETPVAATMAPAVQLVVATTPGLAQAPRVAASTHVAAGPIDRPLQPLGSAFQLSASTDSSEVAIRIGTTLSRPNLNGGARGIASSDSLSLTASAPLNKKAEQTDLATLDGFTNSSLLKVRWTRFLIPIANPRVDPATRQREAVIIEIARAACRTEAAGNAGDLATCNDNYDDAFIEKYAGRALATEFLALGFPDGPSFAFGLEGSVGYRKFSYLDALSLAEQETTKVPVGAKVFMTWFPNASLTAITGSFEYQRAFEEKKSAILCPLAITGPVRCVNGAIEAPARKTALLGALEFRKQFTLKDFWVPGIGIAPQLTHNFKSGESGFDLPIYVVPDVKGNLLGGVRFGYQTKSDDLVVGVFVGSAFSFRP